MNTAPRSRKDTRDILRGAAINLAGTLVRSLKLVLFVILARLYGPEGVGLFFLALAIVDIFSNLGVLGLDQAVLTLAARHHADADPEGMYRVIGQAVGIGLAVSLALTGLVVLAAPWMSEALFAKAGLARPLQVLSCVLPFWTVSGVLLFATRALRVMQYEIIVKSGVEPALMLLLAVGFYFMDLGLVGICLAVVGAGVCGTLTAVYLFSRLLSLRGLSCGLKAIRSPRRLLEFSVPIGMADLINELLKRIDIFLVGRWVPADLLGIYGIAQEGAATLKKIRQAFNPIFIPVVSACHQSGDVDGMRLQYQNVTRWILTLDAAFLVILMLAGRSVMRLFGAEFAAGADVLAILALAQAVNGIFGISELLILIDRPWINLINSAGAVFAGLVLNLLLIPRYGIVGAAVAMLILFAALNLARLLQVAHLYALQPWTRFHTKVAAAFGVSILTVWGAGHLLGVRGTAGDAGAVLAGWILFFSLIWAFGPAPEERGVVDTWRMRLRKVPQRPDPTPTGGTPPGGTRNF